MIDDEIIEDATWLRPRNDTAHINLSELDAVMKGLNMALRWGNRKVVIKTDSSTVFKWLTAVINKTHNVKTRALSERLIRRRLETLREIIETEDICIEPQLVKSCENIADKLTRVPQQWLQVMKDIENSTETPTDCLAGVSVASDQQENIFSEIKRIHDRCHFGVDRTLNLAKQKLGDVVSRKLVKKVVSRCDRCAKIDPPITFKWDKGAIACGSGTWQKLAIDITHYSGIPYLTIIDLTSRYTIWRQLRNESASEVIGQLSQVIAEFGPPTSILSDNGTVFRSREMLELLNNWDIKQVLACAYRPQGNAVVERIHRTVKRCAKRAGRCIDEAVFWINSSRDDGERSPYEIMFSAVSRKPGINTQRIEILRQPYKTEGSQNCDTRYEQLERNPFVVGDRVYLKNLTGRCDSVWTGPHRITSICSSVGVVINEDGVTRHVSHLRPVPGEILDELETDSSRGQYEDSVDSQAEEIDELRRSTRTRKSPDWYGDPVVYCACSCEVEHLGGV